MNASNYLELDVNLFANFLSNFLVRKTTLWANSLVLRNVMKAIHGLQVITIFASISFRTSLLAAGALCCCLWRRRSGDLRFLAMQLVLKIVNVCLLLLDQFFQCFDFRLRRLEFTLEAIASSFVLEIFLAPARFFSLSPLAAAF